ncbi:MAG: SRPBCC family protein [Chloroflexota bacterium]
MTASTLSIPEEATSRVNVGGAARMAGAMLTPLLRRWRTRWGATDTEYRMSLPGDNHVRRLRWHYTHAINIDAPPEAVWPWIAQIGAERAGLYSYQGLENLVGCKINNATRIVPEWQDPKPGDRVSLGPEHFPYFVIKAVQPPQYMLLTDDASCSINCIQASWIFYLLPLENGGTRLLERGRYGYPGTVMNRLGMGPLLTEPISFVMTRKMLLGIKVRAEAMVNAEATQVEVS